MKFSLKLAVVILALNIAWVGAGTTWAQDPLEIIAKRQASMKRQSKDLGAIRGFLEGKVDMATASAAATDLTVTIATILSHFPKSTGMTEFPDKSSARPTIWTEPAKFAAAQQNAAAKVAALVDSIKSGDKTAITVAFDGMIKGGLYDPGNACGGCHTTFRERNG